MYDKPKKILVSGSNSMVTAHQLSDNMVEIVRLDQKMIITGQDFSVMISSPKHVDGKNVYTTVSATAGKIDDSELEYKPEKPKDPPDGKKQKLDDDGKPVVDDDGNPVYIDDENAS